MIFNVLKLSDDTIDDENTSIIPYSSAIPFPYTKMFIPSLIEKQEKGYYCGPASVKTSVHIMNNASESQSTYASSMGTNYNEGTYVYKIADELDKRQSKNDYGWKEINNEADRTRLKEIINIDLLQNNVPLISRVYTEELTQYNGKKLVHYVTVAGINKAMLSGNTIGVIYADNFFGDYSKAMYLVNIVNNLIILQRQHHI